MKMCFCGQPAFGTDKSGREVNRDRDYYCRNHQHLRSDYDGRTILQRAVDKSKNSDVKESDSSLKDLIEDCDRVYSRWLRLSNIVEGLYCVCYTCGVWKMWSLVQCGHFVSRRHLATRWLPANTKIQCKHCNETLRGNLDVFEENLENENPGIVDFLNEQARINTNPTRSDLKEILFDYQQKLKLVEPKII